MAIIRWSNQIQWTCLTVTKGLCYPTKLNSHRKKVKKVKKILREENTSTEEQDPKLHTHTFLLASSSNGA